MGDSSKEVNPARAAAEAYAIERTAIIQRFEERTMWRDAHRMSFLAGVEWLRAHLAKAAPEFDRGEAHLNAKREANHHLGGKSGGVRRKLEHAFYNGARWQHAQLATQLAQARAEGERLRAALEYQLVAWRKACDGSMFTPESERAVAEKIAREALGEEGE